MGTAVNVIATIISEQCNAVHSEWYHETTVTLPCCCAAADKAETASECRSATVEPTYVAVGCAMALTAERVAVAFTTLLASSAWNYRHSAAEG